MVNPVACGLSQATNPMLLSIRFAMNATLRVTRVQLGEHQDGSLHEASGDRGELRGRSARLPHSTS